MADEVLIADAPVDTAKAIPVRKTLPEACQGLVTASDALASAKARLDTATTEFTAAKRAYDVARLNVTNALTEVRGAAETV